MPGPESIVSVPKPIANDPISPGQNPTDTGLVLIVDDDEEILELAASIVQTLGYQAITARNGLEAVDLLRENRHVSNLFTDIQMPGMGGEELAEIAWASRPDLRVVFTSGFGRPLGRVAFVCPEAIQSCRSLKGFVASRGRPRLEPWSPG